MHISNFSPSYSLKYFERLLWKRDFEDSSPKSGQKESFRDLPISAHSMVMLAFECQISQTLPSKTPNRALWWGFLINPHNVANNYTQKPPLKTLTNSCITPNMAQSSCLIWFLQGGFNSFKIKVCNSVPITLIINKITKPPYPESTH